MLSIHNRIRSYLYTGRVIAVTVLLCMTLLLLTGVATAMTPADDHDGYKALSADANDPNEQPMPAQPFALIVLYDKMNDAIAGQRCILPVTVIDEGSGTGAGDPVMLSTNLMGLPTDAVVTIEPNTIRPGEVAEMAIIPIEPNDLDPNHPLRPVDERPVQINSDEPEQDRHVFINLLAERGGVKRNRMIEVSVLPGEDQLAQTAAFYRDLFIPWLAEHHPELGITLQTQWTGTVVKPHILVVTYYLFLSSEWEMGLRWHVMIPPYDWAEIYLRRRSDLSSTLAWRIHSVDGQLEPEVTDLPSEGVFR